jgi:aminomethyltransferase
MQTTALIDEHRALGARLVDFAGWQMPIQYSGILDEHRAVRQRAGLFDLSHMGELWISGPEAALGLAGALVTDPRRLAAGRAHYSMICADDGGIIDDLIVYRLAQERFLLVPNAANREVVAEGLRSRLAPFNALLDDASLRTSLIALQGPLAAGLLAADCDLDLAALRYYAIAEGHAAGVPCHVARTGYTGEDGFELIMEWSDAPAAWRRLLAAGRDAGLLPCGLGARDTLRLEAGMPLYGNELDRATTPFEAGLGRLVKLDKDVDFVGRPALAERADAGVQKMLVGLRLDGRSVARHGHPVHAPGDGQVGIVTSGAPSPTLEVPIAMAYVEPAHSEPGSALEVVIRDARVAAEVVLLPFYKRPE